MESTGESVLSCSIITLPSHPKLKPYHSKASPMMLPQEDEWITPWLDPGFSDVDLFDELLEPAIRQDLLCQEIDAPGKRNPMGESTKIPKD